MNEFEKFDEATSDYSNPHHRKEIRIIYNVIEQMKARGVKNNFFKPEGAARALPIVSRDDMESNKEDFGIRLYCIPVNEYLVILLNGGVKTKLNPEQCPNVKDHFERAVRIASKFFKAVDNGYIEISEYGIKVDESFDFDI